MWAGLGCHPGILRVNAGSERMDAGLEARRMDASDGLFHVREAVRKEVGVNSVVPERVSPAVQVESVSSESSLLSARPCSLDLLLHLLCKYKPAVMMHQRANRREFLTRAGATLLSAVIAGGCTRPKPIHSLRAKPIRGSWISVWWDDRRHHYWNEACLHFTARQWEILVEDVAALDMNYLVLLAIAKGGKAFYDTRLLPKVEMACPDPIEAMLIAADRVGIKFFISSDWYGEWNAQALTDPDCVRKRFQMMEEIASRYGHHRSFYGWYWPNEACLTPYFEASFVGYINSSTTEAKRLTPRAKTLTAPYGTSRAVCDDAFLRQLEKLDVDIIAYQDEVGCLRMNPETSAKAFATLRQAHARVPQRALWADVEVFSWEGKPNDQNSPLIPAPWPRVRAQLEAVSPFADEILIYQYQGLLNRPGTRAFAGHPQSTELYNDYVAWLRGKH